MEKYFGNAYRGDPGVPHADPERFVNIWVGSAAFSALAWFSPYMWQLSNQFKYFSLRLCHLCYSFSVRKNPPSFPTLHDWRFYAQNCDGSWLHWEILAVSLQLLHFSDVFSAFSWHDKAMLFEQYHWKKAMAKKQPYRFKWNEYMDKDHRDSYYHNWPVYFP
ncbi:hypothetical protein SAY87_026770 [Trapa incisa]|uniref:Uncharacterized protein n=1 Tax=Trapa incisa TaxID=236973 RepID=A0AAN7GMC2_9MYRT|nr:hypothetical protein SAY87_026770 [Trapa incisa]